MSLTPSSNFLPLIYHVDFTENCEKTEVVEYLHENRVQEKTIVRSQIKTLKKELNELEKRRRLSAWAKPRLQYSLRKVTEIQIQIFSSLATRSSIPEGVIETLERIIQNLELGH